MDLIKVMIVDDEILSINYLKSLISWEENGFKVVAETVSSKRALEFAARYKPQVIFMDIRMPVMDGLEVSRRILSEDKTSKIILLTSHKDFDYAKQAVEIGVSKYLLKHELDAENLLEELQRLKKELEHDRQKELVATRQCIRDLLENRKPDFDTFRAIEARTRELGENYAFIYVKMDTPYPVLEFEGIAYDLSGIRLEEWEDFHSPDGFIYIDTVMLGTGKWGVLFATPKYHSQRQLWEKLYAAAYGVQREFKQQSGETASIIIPLVFKSLEELTTVYKEIEETAKSLIFFGKEKILRIQDINIPHAAPRLDFREILKSVEIGLSNLDASSVEKNIDLLFICNIPGHYSFKTFKIICHELVVIFDQYRIKKGLPAYNDLLEQNMVDVSRWYRAEDIHQWFIDEAENLIHQVKSCEATGYSKKVQEILQYIHKHYAEDITIDTLAGMFLLSGGYLRNIFKDETGKTVIDYLTLYRIEKAKELLDKGSYKFYEIAEMVGYKTSQYFSQVFKRVTGISPQEYFEGKR